MDQPKAAHQSNVSLFSVFRLEEKENEMRKEFTKVHDRYTELLKVHMDHVERTRGLLGADRLADGVSLKPSGTSLNSWNLNVNLTPPTARSTGPLSFGFASLENATAATSTLPVSLVPPHPQALQEELEMSVDSRDVWSSPSKSPANVVKKFDVAVTSPVHHEGKSLKRK